MSRITPGAKLGLLAVVVLTFTLGAAAAVLQDPPPTPSNWFTTGRQNGPVAAGTVLAQTPIFPGEQGADIDVIVAANAQTNVVLRIVDTVNGNAVLKEQGLPITANEMRHVTWKLIMHGGEQFQLVTLTLLASPGVVWGSIVTQ